MKEKILPDLPIEPSGSRRDTSLHVMRSIHSLIDKMGRLRREFITPVPKELPGGYVMMMVSPLPNSSGEIIGELRVWIWAPTDHAIPVRVRFEWTREAFGFWYRNDFYLSAEGKVDDLVKKVRDAMHWVKNTADGTVRIASMNRMHFKKINKNPNRDKAARIGMVMG